MRNEKFFPILPDEGDVAHIPTILKDYWNNHYFLSGNEKIYKLIMGEPVDFNTLQISHSVCDLSIHDIEDVEKLPHEISRYPLVIGNFLFSKIDMYHEINKIHKKIEQRILNIDASNYNYEQMKTQILEVYENKVLVIDFKKTTRKSFPFRKRIENFGTINAKLTMKSIIHPLLGDIDLLRWTRTPNGSNVRGTIVNNCLVFSYVAVDDWFDAEQFRQQYSQWKDQVVKLLECANNLLSSEKMKFDNKHGANLRKRIKEEQEFQTLDL